MDDKEVLGLTEFIEIKGKRFKAKIDTGADRSSMDVNIAAALELGPIVGVKKIRSTHGKSVRPVLYAEVIIGGKKMRSKFNLVNREGMTCPILIGTNILKRGFLIDPGKK